MGNRGDLRGCASPRWRDPGFSSRGNAAVSEAVCVEPSGVCWRPCCAVAPSGWASHTAGTSSAVLRQVVYGVIPECPRTKPCMKPGAVQLGWSPPPGAAPSLWRGAGRPGVPPVPRRPTFPAKRRCSAPMPAHSPRASPSPASTPPGLRRRSARSTAAPALPVATALPSTRSDPPTTSERDPHIGDRTSRSPKGGARTPKTRNSSRSEHQPFRLCGRSGRARNAPSSVPTRARRRGPQIRLRLGDTCWAKATVTRPDQKPPPVPQRRAASYPALDETLCTHPDTSCQRGELLTT